MTTNAPVPQHNCPSCGRWAWRHVETRKLSDEMTIDVAECTVCKNRVNRREYTKPASAMTAADYLKKYPGKYGDDF